VGALEVTGDNLAHPAYTQVRQLDQAEHLVCDLLALHFDIRASEIGELEIVPILDGALTNEMSQLPSRSEIALHGQADAEHGLRGS
jgi:hypothetical protein